MRIPIIGRLLGLLGSAVRAAGDERSARRLARRLGCSMPQARRLYKLSRERGYGAAYDEVFGGPAAGQ
jgi:hypothetical protein